jgi:hypothetical protein
MILHRVLTAWVTVLPGTYIVGSVLLTTLFLLYGGGGVTRTPLRPRTPPDVLCLPTPSP